MTQEIFFIIPGKPIAKKRPRFVRRGNFVGTYNDQETEEGKWMQQAMTSAMKDPLYEALPLSCPVTISLSFQFPVPSNWPKYKIRALQGKQITFYHTKKPDLDNCIKFVLDCLNRWMWLDDKQVVLIHAFKVYGIEPKTSVLIRIKE